MSRKSEANTSRYVRPLAGLAVVALVALVALVNLTFGSSARSQARTASDAGAGSERSATQDKILSQASPGTLPPLRSAGSSSSPGVARG